jgi:hypothetical protein
VSEIQWDGTADGAPDGVCVHQMPDTGQVFAAHLGGHGPIIGVFNSRNPEWVKAGDWIVTDDQGNLSVRRAEDSRE